MKKDINQLKEEYLKVKAPLEGQKKVVEAMEKAIKEKNNQHRKKMGIRIFSAVAAAASICIILPNTSASTAMAMHNIPFIGGLFKVVTFRNYDYDDGHNMAKVEVPKIELSETGVTEPVENQADEISAAPQAASELGKGVEKINKSVEEYTDTLIQKFEEDRASTGEGYQGLDITYDVISDTNDWFTLKITALETMASGAQQVRYYHIDKTSGQVVALPDLFVAGSDYITKISDEIKRQMVDNMKQDEGLIYFYNSADMPENDFTQISEDQSFYFNEAGELVIAFDEYTVAPGYMGCPEFVIPSSVLEGILQ